MQLWYNLFGLRLRICLLCSCSLVAPGIIIIESESRRLTDDPTSLIGPGNQIQVHSWKHIFFITWLLTEIWSRNKAIFKSGVFSASIRLWTISTFSSSAGPLHSMIGASCQNVVYASDVSKVKVGHDNKRTLVPLTVLPRLAGNLHRRIAIINHYHCSGAM
jgi:hypothetical protein